jgi:hypothetical protein
LGYLGAVPTGLGIVLFVVTSPIMLLSLIAKLLR